MDIEKVKQEYFNTLSELQNEMLLLQSRIKKAKKSTTDCKNGRRY